MGMPKGRLFPLSRDELVEGVAILRSIRRTETRCRLKFRKSRSICWLNKSSPVSHREEWEEQTLYDLMRSAYPYRDLSREEFDDVLRMLAEGFSTRRGRRGSFDSSRCGEPSSARPARCRADGR